VWASDRGLSFFGDPALAANPASHGRPRQATYILRADAENQEPDPDRCGGGLFLRAVGDAMMTSILLIDDHPMVLQGCRTVLEDAGFTEIFETGDLTAGYRLYHRRHPHIIVLDLSLQGKGLAGLKFISHIRMRDRRTPILVFSMHGDPVIVRRALDIGANGYLLKDTAPEDFLDAVSTVRRGQTFLSHQLALQLAMLGEGHSQARMTQRGQCQRNLPLSVWPQLRSVPTCAPTRFAISKPRPKLSDLR
jgi:DNA-binding NarL/FixJ family response regulator